MSMFKRRGKDRVLVQLPPYAAGLLASLAGQIIELLSDGEAVGEAADPLEEMVGLDGPRDVPEDPALRRLLPDGIRGDEEAAAEFRRFTERSLRRSKIDDARLLLSAVKSAADELEGEEPNAGMTDLELELDRDEVRAWMRCLTDMRLTLAERLGVEADDDERWDALPDDDPRVAVHDIYQWLGYLLESLLDAATSR
ncbi:MAG: DUF2017 domain-containing protein [Nocardioidaceae bacterium]